VLSLGSRGPRLRVPRFAAIWLATGLLFAVAPLLAPGSDSRSALLSTLPFAAILAIAAIGQTLVIQQRGLDLSVPGMITLATIVITKVPNGVEGRLPGGSTVCPAADPRRSRRLLAGAQDEAVRRQRRARMSATAESAFRNLVSNRSTTP
jgi:hypothetical protein